MRILALIPARGNSVRVPKKNLRKLGGFSLLAYTVYQALDAGCFTKIIVSTECPDISKESIALGVEVLNRPKNLAEDVPTEDVVLHAISKLADEGCSFDMVVTLQPTSPFRTADTIKQIVTRLTTNGRSSTITVSPIKERPEWMLTQDGKIAFPYFQSDKGPYIRLVASQELPKLFRQNGLVYATLTRHLLEEKTIISKDTDLVQTDEIESFEIDTLMELQVANILLQYLLKNNHNTGSKEENVQLPNLPPTLQRLLLEKNS